MRRRAGHVITRTGHDADPRVPSGKDRTMKSVFSGSFCEWTHTPLRDHAVTESVKFVAKYNFKSILQIFSANARVP